jgi:hypothetical protein
MSIDRHGYSLTWLVWLDFPGETKAQHRAVYVCNLIFFLPMTGSPHLTDSIRGGAVLVWLVG